MRLTTLFCTALFTLLALTTATASADDERVDHFKGKVPADLEEALVNFSQTTNRLSELLEDGVTDAELAEVHQISYTMENAVARLRADLDKIAVLVEEIHLASEDFNGARVSALEELLREVGEPLVEYNEK